MPLSAHTQALHLTTSVNDFQFVSRPMPATTFKGVRTSNAMNGAAMS